MAKTHKECIILSRVSTQTQDYSPQETDLKEYARTFGYTDFHCISTKESGYKVIDGKEGFAEVMDYVKEHPTCKAVFVTEISRLARRQAIIQTIKDWFIKNKIQLYIKDIAFQLFKDDGNGNLTQDMSADIVFAVFASMTESEMKVKKQRFARARKDLQARGLSHTGKVLFGYAKEQEENTKRKKLVIVPELQRQIIDVMTTYVNGINGRSIGIKELTLYAIEKGYHEYFHSRRNVNKLLKEEGYTGEKVTNNKHKNAEYWEYGETDKEKYIVTQNLIRYPILLDKSLFEQVQAKLRNSNTNVDREREHITILSRLIKCNCCGNYLSGSYRKREGRATHTYRCTRRNTVHNCNNANKSYSMPILDAVVWEFLKTFGQDLLVAVRNTKPSGNIEDLKKEISNLEQRKRELDERRTVAANIYKRNRKRPTALQDYDAEMSSIDNEERAIQKRINEKESLIKQIDISRNRNNEIEQAIELYEKDKLQIRNVIREFVKEITVVYSDIKYIILDIKSLLYYVVSASNELGDSVEGEYYAIIDKHDNHRVRFAFSRLTNDFYFDTDKFVVSGKEVTLDEYATIFKDPIKYDEMMKSKGVSLSAAHCSIVETENLVKLDVYHND